MTGAELRAQADAYAAWIDTTRADVLAQLGRIPDNAARRLADALGLDADDVAPPDGDDGDLIDTAGGATALELALRGDPDTRLDPIPDDAREFVGAAGGWRASATFADAALDRVLGAARESDDFALWLAGEADDAVGLASDRTARLITMALRQPDAPTAASLAALRERLPTPAATVSELDAAVARVARVAQDVARVTLEQGGRDVRLAYLGPDDKKTRPFCRALVGRAFKRADLDRGDNGQTSGPIRLDCGGFGCRHVVLAVDASDLADLDLIEGTADDVERATAAARQR